MFEKAVAFREANTMHASTFDELRSGIEQRQFVDTFWCGDAACEERIKNETKASNRCMPIAQPRDRGVCVACGKESGTHAIFARAY